MRMQAERGGSADVGTLLSDANQMDAYRGAGTAPIPAPFDRPREEVSGSASSEPPIRYTQAFSESAPDRLNEACANVVLALRAAASAPSSELADAFRDGLERNRVALEGIRLWIADVMSRCDSLGKVTFLESLGEMQRDLNLVAVSSVLRSALRSQERAVRLGALAGLDAAGDESAEEFIASAFADEPDAALKDAAQAVLRVMGTRG